MSTARTYVSERRTGKDRRRSRAGGRRKGGRPLVNKITFLPSTGLHRFAKGIIDQLTRSLTARKVLRRRAAAAGGTRKAKPGGEKP